MPSKRHSDKVGRHVLAPGDFDTPGRRLKILRLSKEMSQETLGKKVYATQPAVSQWENDMWLPTKQTQVLLAQELGVPRSFLFPEAVA